MIINLLILRNIKLNFKLKLTLKFFDGIYYLTSLCCGDNFLKSYNEFKSEFSLEQLTVFSKTVEWRHL